MPEPPTERGEKEQSTLLILGRLAGFGWYVAVSIAGGALLGVWLDSELDTSPVLLLVGLVLGLVVAALGLVKLLRAFGGSNNGREDAGETRASELKSEDTDRS